MKLNKTLAIVAIVAGSILAGTAMAQDAGKPGAGGAPGGPRGGGTNMIERITKALELTDAQKPKVDAIMKGANEKRKALREDTALSQEDKRAKAKAIQEDTTAQMKAVLTPEQFAKFEKMGQGMRRNGPPGGAPGGAGGAHGAGGDHGAGGKPPKD